jgi:hypothetical protein
MTSRNQRVARALDRAASRYDDEEEEENYQGAAGCHSSRQDQLEQRRQAQESAVADPLTFRQLTDALPVATGDVSAFQNLLGLSLFMHKLTHPDKLNTIQKFLDISSLASQVMDLSGHADIFQNNE